MIDKLDELEAALRRAVELKAEPPEPGTAEHEELLGLLRDIETCNDRLQSEAEQGPLARERAELAQHLTDYSRRYAEQERLAREHREGVGVEMRAIM